MAKTSVGVNGFVSSTDGCAIKDKFQLLLCSRLPCLGWYDESRHKHMLIARQYNTTQYYPHVPCTEQHALFQQPYRADSPFVRPRLALKIYRLLPVTLILLVLKIEITWELTRSWTRSQFEREEAEKNPVLA